VLAPSIVTASSISSGQIGPTYCVAPGQIHFWLYVNQRMRRR